MNEIKNAVITSAEIRNDDHGCLTMWVTLDYGHSGQGFGGYVLYVPPSSPHHDMKSYAGHFIDRCLRVAGVCKVSDMKGKTVRVDASMGKVDGIGHIINDDWFYPSKDFGDAE